MSSKLFAYSLKAVEISLIRSYKVISLVVDEVNNLTKLSIFWLKLAPRSREYSLTAKAAAKSSS